MTSWQQARGSLGDLIAMTAGDNYPPLHNLLIHYSMALFGETEFALRLPSAILGTATVLALYWVGTLCGSRFAGLVAAGLLTFSGFHIWYSDEARTYALLAAAATVYGGTVLWLLSAWSGWRAAASIAVATALLYSHPYGALTFGAIAAAGLLAALLDRRSEAIRYVLVHAVPVVLFLPWALILLGRAKSVDDAGFWIPQVSTERVTYYFLQLMTGPFMLGALLLGLVLVLLPRPADPTAEPTEGLSRRSTLLVLLAWSFLPAVAGVIASLLLEPVLFARYLIGSLPALLLLIGLGVSRLPQTILAPVALVAVAMAGVTSLIGYWPPPRDDFRGIAAELRTTLAPGDCLVMKPESLLGLQYYYRDPLPCVATPRTYDATALPAPATRLFVLLTIDEPTGDPTLLGLGQITKVQDFGYTRLLTVVPR